jgi:hypothetical protein
MFVQVIQGKVSDQAAMRSHVESWASTLGPGAEGWLGTTGGVTDDGTSVAVVRFESDDAARRNSERPEQGDWWDRMATYYDGEPEFRDCDLVDVDTYGDPDGAGFVQVMQGKVTDPVRARDLMAGDTTDWPSFRPEILGSLWASTREGEQKEPPAEAAALMEELKTLGADEPRYLDLRDPWMFSPAAG